MKLILSQLLRGWECFPVIDVHIQYLERDEVGQPVWENGPGIDIGLKWVKNRN